MFPGEARGCRVEHRTIFDKDTGIAFGNVNPYNNPTSDTLRIYRTTDGGNNWTRVSPSQMPPPGNPINKVSSNEGNNFFDAIGDTLWFGTTRGRVYKTVDKGATWNGYPIGIAASGNVCSVQFQDPMNGIAVSDNVSPLQGARTTDGGLTWTTFPLPFVCNFAEYIPGPQGVI